MFRLGLQRSEVSSAARSPGLRRIPTRYRWRSRVPMSIPANLLAPLEGILRGCERANGQRGGCGRLGERVRVCHSMHPFGWILLSGVRPPRRNGCRGGERARVAGGMEGDDEKKREKGQRAWAGPIGWRRAVIGDPIRKQERGDAVGGVGVEHARILSEVGAPC